ncbi:ATP-binding cassette domain-containing protein [Haloferax sp. MBLA0076]|uniref:ATP-binding cassette domain-containing protein n=1 Tax=Haloferax litoreum TaxID=2666140 RepID=A0A6A8GGP9_9EURY|nr:ABC transporter ATP-binding protein [Haloferax sp. CBA1148]MRX22345.1 ATP-binding cassette domain-containing protein [Haloferax litoreum]
MVTVPAIETTGLTKRYGHDVYAVSDLSLTVEEGEVFGFLGPNGAGKSTTIDMLMDFVRPTSGSATILGYDAQDEAEAVHKRVGILPDGYSLYDRLSGRKHIEFAISLKESDDDPDEILARVGLDADAAARPAGTYSKGMSQRLALGMALVGDPDVLILDEPSSGLDPDGIRDIRALARSHADAGGTVFFSSHILSQVEAVCDRVGILSRGRLVAIDTIDGLREAVGTGATITLAVDTPPVGVEFDDIDGITDVALDGSVVKATCTDPTSKVTLVDRVREGGSRILDIETHETSLEDLFSAYTHPVDEPMAVEAER